jgi:hypothetical protein
MTWKKTHRTKAWYRKHTIGDITHRYQILSADCPSTTVHLGGSGVRSGFCSRQPGHREVVDSVNKVRREQTPVYIKATNEAERLCDTDNGLVVCCGTACLETLLD